MTTKVQYLSDSEGLTQKHHRGEPRTLMALGETERKCHCGAQSDQPAFVQKACACVCVCVGSTEGLNTKVAVGHEGQCTLMGICSRLLCLGGPLQTHKEDYVAS